MATPFTAPDHTAWMMNRAAQALATIALVGSIVILLALPLLAFRWVELPFMGAFVEQTLVFNDVGPKGGARWAGIDAGLRFPEQLTAIAGQPVQDTAGLTRALAMHNPGETVTLAYLDAEGIGRRTSITLQSFPTYDLFAYFVAPYLIGLAYLVIGIWVFRTRWGEAAGRAFVLLCAAIAVVVGGLFDLYTTHVFSWVWTLALPLAAGALITLALVFPQENPLLARYPALRWLGFIPAGILAVRGELVVYDMRRPTAYVDAWRNDYAFAAASLLIFLGLVLYQHWRSPSPIAREQARIILWGLALGFGPITYFLVLIAAHVPTVFNVSLYFPPLVAFPLAVAYAILRYRLLDTDRLLMRALVYAALGLVAVVTYTLLVTGASLVTGSVISSDNPFTIALFLFALIVALSPLRDWLQRGVDALFFRGSRAYRQHLQEFSHNLTAAVDLREVVGSLLRQVQSTVLPDHAHVFLYDATTGDFAAYRAAGAADSASDKNPETFSARGDLARTLATRSGALYLPPGVPLPSDLTRDKEPLARAGSKVFIPFPGNKGLAGWLALGQKLSGEPYTREDLSFLEALGDQAALAIERAQLFETEREQRELAEALHDATAALTSTLDLDAVLERIRANLGRVAPHDSANIMILESGVAHVVRRWSDPEYSRDTAKMTRRISVADAPGLRQMTATGQPVVIPDTQADSDWVDLSGSRWVRSYAGAPIRLKGQIIGFLSINSATPGFFTPAHGERLQAFADQAGVAIENAQLFNNLQRSNFNLALAYDATLEGWVRALDLRDKEIEGHTLRVTEMTLRLARAMGLAEEELVNVRRGALLHDIGKMGIPDRILHKPGPLTEEEWEVMRRHPVYAYDMLSPIAYLHPALDIPYCHHERWDGAGYPRGLKGQEIPLVARIFTVVDVWDALRSDRPYRDAWPEERVLGYVRSQTNVHFDPQVVGEFMHVLEREP